MTDEDELADEDNVALVALATDPSDVVRLRTFSARSSVFCPTGVLACFGTVESLLATGTIPERPALFTTHCVTLQRKIGPILVVKIDP